MSQTNVERVIGLLATDECFRRAFARSPQEALMKMANRGVELTASEARSLASLDPHAVERFADCIDPRLQKADLEGGAS